jgi:hypothetical protein
MEMNARLARLLCLRPVLFHIARRPAHSEESAKLLVESAKAWTANTRFLHAELRPPAIIRTMCHVRLFYLDGQISAASRSINRRRPHYGYRRRRIEPIGHTKMLHDFAGPASMRHAVSAVDQHGRRFAE